MATLVNYKAIEGGDVQEVSPEPEADGGAALNANFRAIADSLPRNNYGASVDPAADNDSIDTADVGVDFSQGSFPVCSRLLSIRRAGIQLSRPDRIVLLKKKEENRH